MAEPKSILRILAYGALCIWHALYSILVFVRCLIPRSTPYPLVDPRRKQTPRHIAVVLDGGERLAAEDVIVRDMLECTRKMVQWCGFAGLETLTVYDRKGLLKTNTTVLLHGLPESSHFASLQTGHQAASHLTAPAAQPNVQYPMTPPPSDSDTASSTSSVSSDSSVSEVSPVITILVPVSTQPPPSSFENMSGPSSPSTGIRRRRRTLDSPELDATTPTSRLLRLNLICRDQGKPAVARAARQLAFQQATSPSPPASLRIQDVDRILQAELPEPDLLIIHPLLYPPPSFPPRVTLPKPLELYGFPPWQIRLTEIYYDPLPPSRFLQTILPSSSSVSHSQPEVEQANDSVTEVVNPSFHRVSSAVITEFEFRRALDLFGSADFKVGK